MSLFGKKAANVAVIDIRSSSIGVGYAVLGATPTLVYTKRIPLAPNATEPVMEALPRTLTTALSHLTTEGAPLLRKATGTASVERVFVTFTAPWQRSRVEVRVIEKDKPFVFDKQALNLAVGKAPTTDGDMERVAQMVIATLLNGYEVGNPFGKKVNRAELVMLSSFLDTALMQLVEKILRKALHQHHIEFNAFIPEAYAVMRSIYPHQKDFLFLDIGSEATDALLAKHGLLASMNCMPHGVGEMTRAAHAGGISSLAVPTIEGPVLDLARNQDFAGKTDLAKSTWIEEMRGSLAEIAKQEPLPRTVFLLAEENVRDFLKNLLDDSTLRSLWLTDEAICILPVMGAQFGPFLMEGSVSPADPALAILALAAARAD